MQTIPFRARIRGDRPQVGTLVTLKSAEVAEVLSMSGLDWLFIDMEHGPLDIPAIQGLVRATVRPCLSLVRVPENSALWIKRVLDTGCDGIIVPLVTSADDARRAVDAARYPPIGHRSVGIGRAHGYGIAFGQYITGANDHVTVIIQIEHITAVETVDEILQIPGVDGILIGPNDLAGSMNHLGDIGHPDVQKAIATVRTKCRSEGMPVGIFVLHPDDVRGEIARGIDFLAVGADVTLLTAAARQVGQQVTDVKKPLI